MELPTFSKIFITPAGIVDFNFREEMEDRQMIFQVSGTYSDEPFRFIMKQEVVNCTFKIADRSNAPYVAQELEEKLSDAIIGYEL